MKLKHGWSIRRLVLVEDGFWLTRDWRRMGGSAGGEHRGCGCTGTQWAHTGMVAPCL